MLRANLRMCVKVCALSQKRGRQLADPAEEFSGSENTAADLKNISVTRFP